MTCGTGGFKARRGNRSGESETQVTAMAVAGGETSGSEREGDCSRSAKPHFKSCEGCYPAGCEGSVGDKARISGENTLIARRPHF